MMCTLLAFIGAPGPMELLLIFGIFVLLFGATKLPGLAKSMGQSINQFKKGMREGEEEEFDKGDYGEPAKEEKA